MGRLTQSLGIVGLSALVTVASVGPLSAQSRDELAAGCRIEGPPAPGGDACTEAALAVEALLGGVGLALAGGHDLPGSPSTLGRRYGSSPRLAVAARAGLVSLDHPDLASVDDGRQTGGVVPTLQAQLAVGLFDGFFVAPTVGGVLSLDLFGTWGVAFVPGSTGLEGTPAAFGYGARLGLLRESFSLPAVTVSLARRHGSGFELGEESAPGVRVDDFTTTSVRASVGKEFLALGVLAGFGWDRTRGEGEMRAEPGAVTLSVQDFDDARAERWVFYGGVTRTWLVLQASLQGGFATGYDDRPDSPPEGAYDPTAGAVFGSLSFRLLF